jgi:anti-anti-sigma factor
MCQPLSVRLKVWRAAQAGLAHMEGRTRAVAVLMTPDPGPPFGVITSYNGYEAILTLQGNMEHDDAFELGAILDAAIDRRPVSMVLDVSGLDFIGPAGLIAIANAEKRLAQTETPLTIRSPSDLVNVLLGLMDAAELSRRLDQATLAGQQLKKLEDSQAFMLTERTQSNSSADFRGVTAMPSDPDVIDGALRLIVELARALVEGADGVSVSLLRHGRLSTVAASDQTIMEMDADQYKTGQGPCVDASLQGEWFHASSLADETRWPEFTPQALGLGINAILSSPLKAFDQPVGALNIYSRTPLAFHAKDQAAAAVFAKKASVILSDAGAGVSDTQMALRYQEALVRRKTITLATGILMERYGVDEEAAFTDLLQLSLHRREPLREQAQAMVHSARRPALGPEFGLDE